MGMGMGMTTGRCWHGASLPWGRVESNQPPAIVDSIDDHEFETIIIHV